MMKTRLLTVAAVLLGSALLGPSHALAWSGRMKVVARGQAARAIDGWPEGALAVINDPVRASGWHSWFSECPNDGYYYEMDVRRPEHVNRLITILAAVRAEGIQVRLDPAEGGRLAARPTDCPGR